MRRVARIGWGVGAMLTLVAACSEVAEPVARCGGQTECGELCVSLATDNDNCGACGAACAQGEVCSEGTCAVACPEDRVACDGGCIDPKTSSLFCGASGDCTGDNAGAACEAGTVCDGAGTCALSCQAGLVACDGTCIDPDTDGKHCGATGDCEGANAGTSCEAGFVCNGSGVCELSCQQGLVACDGKCIDPNNDEAFCGASGDCLGPNAGQECAAGFACNGAGQCALQCQEGLEECAGTCTDTSFDPAHCGGCNSPCASGEACVEAKCVKTLQGKTCDEINHPNGYQVVVEPGKVLLGADQSHAVRCMQVSPTKIHIYETSNFDCLRFANVGIFAGRGLYQQSIRDDSLNIQRICAHLGYANATGTTTGVNSSIEVVVDADMNGFMEVGQGNDWLTFDCSN